MITDILLLTSFPFSERDFDRFGIEILKRHFRVRVFDCTPWIAPHSWEKYSDARYLFPGYFTVANEGEFRKQIAKLSTTVVVDILGEASAETQSIRNVRRALKERNILRALLRLGQIPMPEQGRWTRLRAAFQRANSVNLVLNAIRKKMRSLAAPQLPDIAVLSGEVGLNDRCARAPHRVWAHSYDYDIFLNIRDKPRERTQPYAVFLDEDMVHHSDFHHLGVPSPATEEGYYPALNSFFAKIEKMTRVRTVIAAHPRSRYDTRPRLLAGREVVLGKSAELVRDASLVFAHASTAIAFAVLWRKPLVFITTDELQSSVMAPHIRLRSELFHAPIVNVNKLGGLDIDLKKWMTFDESAYADYMRQYVKSPGTPESPLWEIFAQYVCQL